MKRSLLLGAALASAGFFGCATPAVVFISPGYTAAQTQRVALLGFDDFPGQQGSGAMVADVFESYLLKGPYQLVERNQAQQVLDQQNLTLDNANSPKALQALGQALHVDAVVLGSVSELSETSEQTVMVDVPQEETEPVYQDVLVPRRHGERVVTMQTGTQTIYSDTEVPETETLPARVGLSARLVSVKTSSLLWSGSSDGDGLDLSSAAQDASSKLTSALWKKLNVPH